MMRQVWAGLGRRRKLGRHACAALAMTLAGFTTAASAAGIDARTLERLKSAADVVEIEQLLFGFGEAMDSGRLDELAGMFTPDGGLGHYTQDPATSRLTLTGRPGGSGLPGCLAFGPANVKSALAGLGYGGDSPRPHLPDSGKLVTRHPYSRLVTRVVGDQATVRMQVPGSLLLYETNLTRMSKGWRIHFIHVIYDRPRTDRPCTIIDPKFPLPKAGTPGATPDLINPDF